MAFVAILVALTVQTMPAFAATVLLPSSGTGSLANLAFPASMTISRDAAIGTPLNSQTANVGLSASGVTCDVQKNVTVNGSAVSGDAQTFQTNVPGIGVRFYITNGWNGGFVQVPISQTLVSPTGATAHYTRADLVVTGPVGAGSLTTLPSMTVTFSGSCITTVSTTQYLTTGSAVTSNTCSVTTPALVFNLAKGLSKNLPTVGATTGDTTLPIGLNCAAGVKVAVTITDATTPLNRTTTLSLAPGSSASGIGIQILNGSTPVAFGPDSAVAGTANQWSAGTAAGGVMQIPITARYVRTSATLVPGSVAARATFTMSYQ